MLDSFFFIKKLPKCSFFFLRTFPIRLYPASLFQLHFSFSLSFWNSASCSERTCLASD